MSGSLINGLYANSNNSKTPEVGDGVTFLYWSDRKPGTVVEVVRFKSGARKGEVKGIKVQEDHVELISGSQHTGDEKYEITPDTNAPVLTYNLRGGKYIQVGSDGMKLVLGGRDYHQDMLHF